MTDWRVWFESGEATSRRLDAVGLAGVVLPDKTNGGG